MADAQLLFEDDFAGGAAALAGRVRPGGVWQNALGGGLATDGSGRLVTVGGGGAYVTIPNLYDAQGLAIEFTAIFDGASTGRAYFGTSANSGPSVQVQIESSGTVIRFSGYIFNFTQARGSRTSAKVLCCMTNKQDVAGGSTLQVFVDDVLAFENLNFSVGLSWGNNLPDVIAQIASFASQATAIKIDQVKFYRLYPSEFWTAFVTSFEVP